MKQLKISRFFFQIKQQHENIIKTYLLFFSFVMSKKEGHVIEDLIIFLK